MNAMLRPRGALACLLLGACTGAVVDGTAPKDPVSRPGGSGGGMPDVPPREPPQVAGQSWDLPEAGPASLRRLTNEEYRNTLRSLVGHVPPRALDLENEPISKAGLNNVGASLVVSANLAAEYADIALEIAKSFVFPPCSGNENECAKVFVTTFGKRAFRRPLLTDDVDRYLSLYADERTRVSHNEALGQVVETLLQSPKFLYRFELGEPRSGGERWLDSYERASQLSYLFTGSMPDDELFEAADRGALETSAQIEAQARRLLRHEGARPRLLGWLKAYAGITRFAEISKDVDLYPEFTPALKSAMREETERFLAGVLFDGDGTFTTLMTADFSFLDRSLATFYGVTAPAADFGKAKLDNTQRSGLLTQASVLAMHSKTNQSFPILRGKLVRVGLLCQSLPAPPMVVPEPPAPTDSSTTRERFERHASDPACVGCHQLIDPLGFGLENYDAVGRYRTTENGKPVDARGALTGTSNADGPFVGGVELARKLAASEEARRCIAMHAFRWAFGRFESQPEEEGLGKLVTALAPGGVDLREILVALTQSTVFVKRAMP